MKVEILFIIGLVILACVVYCIILICYESYINFKLRKEYDLQCQEEEEKEPLKIFKVNDFITLKLLDDETIIYVCGELFLTCKYLLMNIILDNRNEYNDIESIDEAAESLNHELEITNRYNIPPEIEFWGHCSNL